MLFRSEAVMNRSVLKGGKRLRPFLMAEFGELFGIQAEQIRPFARAAEQVHSATLAHDDVIDGSDKRRGLPTLNARIENRRAVLGGDYLLAEGIFEVARQGNFAVLESLSATLRELVTGELLQNEARGRADVSAAHILRVADLKTGSLFRWCCAVPALLSNSGEEAIRLTHQFATRLGTGFQWVDDALDYSKDSGKPYAQDLREGLVNEVTRHLLQNFPDSKPVVESFLSKDLTDSDVELKLPWTESEIEAAKRETKDQAMAQFASARRYLSDLILELKNGGRMPSEAAVKKVERILDQLERREK